MSTLSVNKITDLTDFTFPPTTTLAVVGVTGSGASTFGSANVGNLSITNTSGRVSADFTNATVASRVIFQTSTLNGTTGIYAVPNGTSTGASWQAANTADPTNASKILIATNGSTDVQLVSGINGTGTYLPLSFYTGGSERARFDTSGNVAIGSTATDQGKLSVYGANAGSPATSGSADPNITTRTRVQSVALDIGTYAAGQTWIQNRNYANYATNYDLVLQPNGGNLGVGGLAYCKTDVTGVIRTTSVGAPSTGVGLELSYGGTANTADILAYDRTNAAFKNIEMRANSVIFNVGGGGEKVRIGSAGQIGLSGAYGTSGQVLTSAGAGAAPTWSTISSTGTVTSIATGTGLTGGTITTSGTIALVTTYGAVGTYGFFARAVNQSITAGTSYAGSSLTPAAAGSSPTGAAPSGTWQAMGQGTNAGGCTTIATVFIRIA